MTELANRQRHEAAFVTSFAPLPPSLPIFPPRPPSLPPAHSRSQVFANLPPPVRHVEPAGIRKGAEHAHEVRPDIPARWGGGRNMRMR